MSKRRQVIELILKFVSPYELPAVDEERLLRCLTDCYWRMLAPRAPVSWFWPSAEWYHSGIMLAWV
jgi:hypothetical protein